MSWVVYAGQLGNGKTLGMVGKALRIKQRFPALPIYSNIDIQGITGKVTSWQQLISLQNCLVLLDEGHILFDSRDFKNNINKTHFALQSRHNGLNVICTTQVLDQLDLRIRRIIDKLILCEKHYDRQNKLYFKYIHLTPSALNTNVFTIGRTEYLLKPELIWDKYSTKEIVHDLDDQKRTSLMTKNGHYNTFRGYKGQLITKNDTTHLIGRLNALRSNYQEN